MIKTTIVAAAIKSDYDGVIYHVPKPGRHSDVIFMLVEQGHPRPITGLQGFLTSNGQFVDRHLALSIAYLSGQVSQELYDRKTASEEWELFSEDVWRGHFYDHYVEQYKLYITTARRNLFDKEYVKADWCFERARNIWLYKLDDNHRNLAIGVI